MPFAFKQNSLNPLKSEWVLQSELQADDKIICLTKAKGPFHLFLFDGATLLFSPQKFALNSFDQSLLVIGEMEQHRILLLEIESSEEFAKQENWIDLRTLSLQATSSMASLAAMTSALSHWHRKNLYCGHCGQPTKLGSEHSRVCSNKDCGQISFPRIDPAVIMAVVNDKDEILLGRQASWDENRYSVIAGFLSHGETLEQCVAREVLEETAVVIDSCHYQASQPWPFPGSIMLGFSARAKKQEVRTADNELENAFWISREELQLKRDNLEIKLSPKLSISRYLIDLWLENKIP